MDKKFDNLVLKFNEINKKGWIKAINDYHNAVGMTFESLLGKEEDQFSYPDFDGIEIKTQNAGTDYNMTLFSLAPMGSVFPKLDDLRKKFGYYDYDEPENRRLNLEFFYDKNVLISNRYFFNLEINYEEEKIYLKVYDIHHKLIEKDAFWYFSDIKEKFDIKLKYLAYVFAHKSRDDRGKEIFKYFKLECYIYKNFDVFLNLLERNIISISISSETVKYGPSKGNIKCGCYFKIGKHDLRKLFTLDREINTDDRNYL